MTSAIDPTQPSVNAPSLAKVRANFAAVKSEIEALQVIGTWTPTIRSFSPGGTPPTFTLGAAQYTKIGRQVVLHIDFTVTAAGTGTSVIGITLPPGMPAASTSFGGGYGREVTMVGYSTISSNFSTTELLMNKYDATSAIATAHHHTLTHIYTTQ